MKGGKFEVAGIVLGIHVSQNGGVVGASYKGVPNVARERPLDVLRHVAEHMHQDRVIRAFQQHLRPERMSEY